MLKDIVDIESEDESEHEITCENYKSPLDNEIACMSIAMSVADDPEILTRKEILIADTAATVDSVNDPTGMVNIQRAVGKGIIMGNGLSEKANKIGDVPGTFYTKNGTAQISATVRRVRYLPTGAYNLFSVTKRMLDGWTAYADKEGIKLTKERSKHL